MDYLYIQNFYAERTLFKQLEYSCKRKGSNICLFTLNRYYSEFIYSHDKGQN